MAGLSDKKYTLKEAPSNMGGALLVMGLLLDQRQQCFRRQPDDAVLFPQQFSDSFRRSAGKPDGQCILSSRVNDPAGEVKVSFFPFIFKPDIGCVFLRRYSFALSEQGNHISVI